MALPFRGGMPIPRGGSLRRRIVVRFAGVALLLSLGLGLATYLTFRNTVLEDRETAAVEQVVADATLVAASMEVTGINEAELLATLRPPTRSRPLLSIEGQWYTASLQVQPTDVPEPLQAAVFAGTAASQRFDLSGEPVLGVGVPFSAVAGGYFEVFPLGDVAATLSTLARTLILAGVGATALGALAGWGIARRILRPLDSVSGVAIQIAAGELDTRLDEAADQDLARLTASFNAMADSLQQRIAREAQFSSDVSHELRSPLTTLATSVSVLERRRHELSPEGREALDLLAADLNRFQTLVADLLEMSRHDAGAVVVERTPFEAATFARRMLRRLGADDVPLDVQSEAESAVLLADELRLERSLANVLNNARLHGGETIRMIVEADQAEVRFCVEDDGNGVPEDEREVIFDRFARGMASTRRGSRDGSGLGLALARENVKAQGGRIYVEDAPSGGARFVIAMRRADT